MLLKHVQFIYLLIFRTKYRRVILSALFSFVCLPSGGEAVKPHGLITINPGLVTDFPPLLECLRYMIDCTFS